MKTARRAFLTGIGAAIFAPRGAGAQATRKVARVGWIAGVAGPVRPTPEYLESFKEGMRERGWDEGQNLAIEARWGSRDQAGEFAAELARAKVDLIVAQGPMVTGTHAVASGIPIVFGFSGDPARPCWSPLSPGPVERSPA